jgi:hypothetical protein
MCQIIAFSVQILTYASGLLTKTVDVINASKTKNVAIRSYPRVPANEKMLLNLKTTTTTTKVSVSRSFS